MNKSKNKLIPRTAQRVVTSDIITQRWPHMLMNVVTGEHTSTGSCLPDQ